MKRRNVTMVITAFAMLILILKSRSAVEYAAQGIDLCIRTVIPSLFPFFLVSIYLTGNLGGGSGRMAVLISGFLGGYPVGAQAAADAYRAGRITRETANRMLMFCSQAGPAFLFGMVAAQFPERKYAWLLWIIQILSALSVAAIVHIPDKPQRIAHNTLPVPLTQAMKQAIRAMASVCGWVVIFRVILGFTAFLPLSISGEIFLSGLLELTNGCIRLGSVDSISLRFLLAAILLNFGGLCVMLQTASVIGQLRFRYYLFGKMLQTGFAAAYCLLFQGHYLILIPIISIFLLFCRSNFTKRSSIPARLGV